MAQKLSLFSETQLENIAPNGFPVGCPTLDLSVVRGAEGKNILIHRPPGQVVSRIHQLGPPGGKPPEALAVTWKADGQFLAVGWSDGYVRLMGLENSKAAHHIEVCSQLGAARIAHIGWACTKINARASAGTELADHFAGELSFGRPSSDAFSAGQTDLPRELAFLEIETALPKISPLPGGSAGSGEDATVFTLRTGIDFLFQLPGPEEYDKINVMVVGTTEGKLHLSIYDSFVVGSFSCPPLRQGPPLQLIRFASNSLVSTHALLMGEPNSRHDELHLLPMDLPFIFSAPINLSLLASKLTMLQKLLRYLRQTQLHMQFEWRNSRELPSRFLRSVQLGLEEMGSGPRDIVSALYHTVVTGHAYEPVREWLVESLAERGHKRWDKAAVSGLENLRALVHENFLPALGRCSIILSRLRGLAQFYDDREDIGFSVTQINKVTEIVSCLTLVGNKMLLCVMDELEHFRAFSTWLRFQIDRLASSSSEGDELTEKEATMDTSAVLTYIEQYLNNSPLGVYLDEITPSSHAKDWSHIESGPVLLDVLKAQMKKHESGQDAMQALLRVEFLVDYSIHSSQRVFNCIAEATKRSVRFGRPVKLSIGSKVDHFDVCMCGEGQGEATLYTALASNDQRDRVYIYRLGLSIVNGISSNRALDVCSIDLGERELVDLVFLGDDQLVLLCKNTDGAHVVICAPFKSESFSFCPSEESDKRGSSFTCDQLIEYHLPGEPPMKPDYVANFDISNSRMTWLDTAVDETVEQ